MVPTHERVCSSPAHDTTVLLLSDHIIFYLYTAQSNYLAHIFIIRFIFVTVAPIEYL